MCSFRESRKRSIKPMKFKLCTGVRAHATDKHQTSLLKNPGKGSVKALRNSAGKPLIMDSVSASCNTYKQYETYLRPKDQNWNWEVAQKPHPHIPTNTPRSCSFPVGGASVEG